MDFAWSEFFEFYSRTEMVHKPAHLQPKSTCNFDVALRQCGFLSVPNCLNVIHVVNETVTLTVFMDIL